MYAISGRSFRGARTLTEIVEMTNEVTGYYFGLVNKP